MLNSLRMFGDHSPKHPSRRVRTRPPLFPIAKRRGGKTTLCCELNLAQPQPTAHAADIEVRHLNQLHLSAIIGALGPGRGFLQTLDDSLTDAGALLRGYLMVARFMVSSRSFWSSFRSTWARFGRSFLPTLMARVRQRRPSIAGARLRVLLTRRRSRPC